MGRCRRGGAGTQSSIGAGANVRPAIPSYDEGAVFAVGRMRRDRIYPWEAALLLTVFVYWWGVVYPPLCVPGSAEVQETAVIYEDNGETVTEEAEEYVFRFKVLEWWDQLTQRWE